MREIREAVHEQSSQIAAAEPVAQTTHIPAVIAGFSGWLLDAFDFFLVTLLFRPIGGFVFGIMADRYGRRLPLMINIAVFAVAEILTGLAPSYTALLIVRALFGVVMGGNWGVGASLAMEGAPKGKRGVLSGLLQEGYAAGNVVAAICFFALFNRLGWRPLFFLGCIPAIALLLFLRFNVKESEVWKKANRVRVSGAQQVREILSHWKLFLYLLVFMTMMLFSSHGTQDMYQRSCSGNGTSRPSGVQPSPQFQEWAQSSVAWCSGTSLICGGAVRPSSSPSSLASSSFRSGRTRPIRRFSFSERS